ncbi:glycosyl transferase [Pasteurellaceae bacterium Orientalotternb1]|nr:glycosyl transferase [Pasteurellaceae bacterium Orientalotternb1]
MILSVVISIYEKEKSYYFHNAMNSIWNEQKIKPDEIILIEDGKLTCELYDEISIWKKIIKNKLKIISLDCNVGLANALNIAISSCCGKYIARMDTDDIALFDRFEKQINFLENNLDVDVVGTWMSEIDENNNLINSLVEYPLTHSELFDFFAKRDPLAHPTVMFRNTFFEKAGLYSNKVHLAEDTLLWYSGFINNCRFANIPYVGLKFRRASAFYLRRANWKKSWGLLKFRLLHINRKLGYGFKADLYAIAYFIMSISPSFVKKWLYSTFR